MRQKTSVHSEGAHQISARSGVRVVCVCVCVCVCVVVVVVMAVVMVVAVVVVAEVVVTVAVVLGGLCTRLFSAGVRGVGV